jgi:hypothetical protein
LLLFLSSISTPPGATPVEFCSSLPACYFSYQLLPAVTIDHQLVSDGPSTHLVLPWVVEGHGELALTGGTLPRHNLQPQTAAAAGQSTERVRAWHQLSWPWLNSTCRCTTATRDLFFCSVAKHRAAPEILCHGCCCTSASGTHTYNHCPHPEYY